jgi:hypothetical protein
LCEWSTDAEKDRALVNQLVRGINSDVLRMKLLQSELQLFEELMAYAMQLETTEKGSQKIAEAKAGASSSAAVHVVEDVNATRTRGFGRGNRRYGRSHFGGPSRADQNAETVICKHCGSRHAKSREVCNARDHVCTECSKQGHFEAFCFKLANPGGRPPFRGHQKRCGQGGAYGSPPKRGRQHEQGYALHDEGDAQGYDQEEILRGNPAAASPDGQVSMPCEFISEILHVPRDDAMREWFETVSFCMGNLTMKIDSGATVDVMPLSSFKQLKLPMHLVSTTSTRLVTYSQTVIKPIVEFHI